MMTTATHTSLVADPDTARPAISRNTTHYRLRARGLRWSRRTTHLPRAWPAGTKACVVILTKALPGHMPWRRDPGNMEVPMTTE